MWNYFDIIFRVCFFIFLISAYIATGFFKGLFNEQNPLWKDLLTGSGIIFYIVAAAAILISHRSGTRPFFELPVAFVMPYAVYALIFNSLDVSSKSMWNFTASFQFISIAGGFFIGIFLSPLIAIVIGKVSSSEAVDFTLFGIRFINKLGLNVFAIALFSGVAMAIVYFTGSFIEALDGIGITKKILFYVFLAECTGVIAFYTFTLTRFSTGIKF